MWGVAIDVRGCRATLAGRILRFAVPAAVVLRDGCVHVAPAGGGAAHAEYDLASFAVVTSVSACDGAAVDVTDTTALSLDHVTLCATRGSTLRVADFLTDALTASASLGGVIHGCVACRTAGCRVDYSSRLPRVHVVGGRP